MPKGEITFLDASEIEALAQFVHNATMREAVKKVLLYDVYNNGVLKPTEPAIPTRNAALGLFAMNRNQKISDAELGQDLRAYGHAVFAIEGAFDKMQEIVPSVKPAPKPDLNQAR